MKCPIVLVSTLFLACGDLPTVQPVADPVASWELGEFDFVFEEHQRSDQPLGRNSRCWDHPRHISIGFGTFPTSVGIYQPITDFFFSPEISPSVRYHFECPGRVTRDSRTYRFPGGAVFCDAGAAVVVWDEDPKWLEAWIGTVFDFSIEHENTTNVSVPIQWDQQSGCISAIVHYGELTLETDQ